MSEDKLGGNPEKRGTGARFDRPVLSLSKGSARGLWQFEYVMESVATRNQNILSSC